MKNQLAILLLVVGAVAQAPAQEARSQVFAFTSVNVIPMDRERVLANQTVIVRDGRIAEIGPADKVKVPEGAQRIDGRGKYLLPGLADMHVHIGQGAGQISDSPGRSCCCSPTA